MNKFIHAIKATLMAAARARAKQIMLKQEQVSQPWKEVYSSNAGGWK